MIPWRILGLALLAAAPTLALAQAPVLYSESLNLDASAEIVIDLDDPAIEIVPVSETAAADEVDLGEIEVTGERSLLSRLDDARALTVIHAADFGQAMVLGDIIERVPGVEVRNQGGLGQLSSILVRGARSSQVLILVDGQPLAGESADLALLPLGPIDRIEVLRGPAAARFGSGALGGVVNLITAGPDPVATPPEENTDYLPLNENRSQLWPEQLPDTSRYTWTSRLTGGSHGALGYDLRLSEPDTQYFISHLQARNNYDYRRSAGNQAVRRNNDVSRQSFWVAWNSGATHHRAGFTHLERGVPGPAEFPTLRARLKRDSLWWQTTADGWRAGLTAGQLQFTDPEPLLNRGEIDTRSSELHLDLAYGADAGVPADWGVRLRLDYSDGDDTGSHTRPGLDAHQSWSATHGNLRLLADAGVTASSGLSIDPVGNVGAEYDLGHGSRTYASVGYAVRHPSFSELYYADMGGVRGNPDLDSESVLNYEVGFDWTTSRARFEMAGFFSDYRNSIIWAPVSAYTVEAINTGAAEVAGLEALADVMLTERWWWRTAATWLPHAEYDSGVPLTGRAQSHLNSRLEYVGGSFTGSFSLDHTGPRPADLFGSLVIDPQTRCDAELSQAIGSGRIGLAVTNIFAEQARDSWDYPLPGREVFLSWTTTF